jgi:hypothetical protein
MFIIVWKVLPCVCAPVNTENTGISGLSFGLSVQSWEGLGNILYVQVLPLATSLETEGSPAEPEGIQNF